MDWIEKIIRIDSVTHRSNADVVRFLYPLLEESGLKIEEQKVTEGGETFINLIAFSHSPQADDLLVLNTHLDTVSGGSAEAWSKTDGDPFRATQVRDRIYGLGTADVKLDFLCKLIGARTARPWKSPFALVGTFGEERGLVGASHLLKEKKVKPRYALVGEPSNLELIYAHKGHLICTLGIDLGLGGVAPSAIVEKQWKGKAAHSSTPDLGDNALRKGLNDIFKRGLGIVSLAGGSDTNRVPERCEARLVQGLTAGTKNVFKVTRALDELAKDLKKRRDARFSPAVITLSMNKAVTIDGELHLSFDIRTLPDTNPEKLKAKVLTLAEETGCRIVDFSQDPPLRGKKNSRFMEAAARSLKASGVKKVIRKTKASSTEAAVYNQFGAEAIIFGPGISIGNVHRPNEHNSLKQLQVATRFYSTVLQTEGGFS